MVDVVFSLPQCIEESSALMQTGDLQGVAEGDVKPTAHIMWPVVSAEDRARPEAIVASCNWSCPDSVDG